MDELSGLMLPEGMRASLEHCGQPMVYDRAHITWTGKPNEGTEQTENHYKCAACPTKAVLTVVDEC